MTQENNGRLGWTMNNSFVFQVRNFSTETSKLCSCLSLCTAGHPQSSVLDSALCIHLAETIHANLETITLFAYLLILCRGAASPSGLATQPLSHQQHSIIDLCQTRYTCHLSAALPLFHYRITAPFNSISFTALYHSLGLLGSAIHCGQPRVEHGARDRLRGGRGRMRRFERRRTVRWFGRHRILPSLGRASERRSSDGGKEQRINPKLFDTPPRNLATSFPPSANREMRNWPFSRTDRQASLLW